MERLNKRILVLSKYSAKGASSRYRFYNYLPWLEQHQFEVEFAPLFGDKYIESLYANNKTSKLFWTFLFLLRRFYVCFFKMKSYNHVIIEGELFPHFPLAIDRFFLKNITSFSLDFDDNISANYQNTTKKDKIPSLMKMANFVCVGNRWYLSEFEGNLQYLPTVINLDAYPIHSKISENKSPVIVWIGSPSTIKYIKLIENVLVNLSDKYDFTLKIIGGKLELNPKINCRFVEWSAATENKELATSDIGIMPLENTYWEKGKCGFKLIQYMASGLPVVGSDLPANQEIIVQNENGYIAKNQEDWYNYLEKLLSDYQLRIDFGINARNRIETNYSYQIWGEKFSKIIFTHLKNHH